MIHIQSLVSYSVKVVTFKFLEFIYYWVIQRLYLIGW